MPGEPEQQAPEDGRFDLCGLEELQAKGAIPFEFIHPRRGRHQIALFWDGETVGALDNFCPHEGAMLTYGLVEPGQVLCPLHSAVFDIRTGECLDRYTYDVRPYPVEVVDGRVWVEAPGERHTGPWQAKARWGADGHPRAED